MLIVNVCIVLMRCPSCPAATASFWLFYLHFLVHLPHALTQLSQPWVNLFSVWKNGEGWYHSINNVDNLFTNELQTIPLILNMYIRRKNYITQVLSDSLVVCPSDSIHHHLHYCHQPPVWRGPRPSTPVWSSLRLICRASTFSSTCWLTWSAWWFCWRWSEKNNSPLVLSVSSSSLPVRQLLCNFHFIQLQLHDHVPTVPQLQFPPESRDLGDLLLQGGGHPLLPALVPV